MSNKPAPQTPLGLFAAIRATRNLLNSIANRAKHPGSGKRFDERTVTPEPVLSGRPPIRRNKRCPCGSGRKWKRCCGEK